MAEEKKKKPRSAADAFSPGNTVRREVMRYFPNTFSAAEDRVIAAKDASKAGNTPQAVGHSVAAPFMALTGLAKDITERVSTPFSPVGIPSLFSMAAKHPSVNGFVEGILDMPAETPAAAVTSKPNKPAVGPASRNPFAGNGALDDQLFEERWQRMIHQESRGQHFRPDGRPTTSPAGAIGIAQVMPGTAREAARLAGVPYDENKYRNDPAYNELIGKAYFRHQYKTFGDIDLATAAYNAGPGNVRKALERGGANWSAFLPGETKDYLSITSGGTVGRPGFSGGFDPAAFNGQLQAINDWGAAHTPFNAEFDLPARPELPDAPKLPERDFAAQDQALAELKPIMMSELETKRVTRANMFSGLAKGLASIPEGAGVGTVLAQLGAGMLAGRGAADAEIQARMDKFDEKMTAWKMLNLRNESEKANLMHQDAVKEVEVMYQHNMNNYRELAARYNADNNISMQGNYIVFQSRKGDKGSIHAVPFTPAVNIGMATMRAGVMGNIADAQTRSSQLEAAATNQVIMSEYTQQARTAYGGRQGMEALVAMPSIAASEIVSNGWISDVFGPEEEATLMESARASVPPGSEMTESGRKRFDEVLAGKIGFRIMTDPKFQERVGIAMPGLVQSYTARRYNEGQTTTTYGPKGVTTRQEY